MCGATNRLSGQDRYQTSVAIAENYNGGLIDNVMVAAGNSFADVILC